MAHKISRRKALKTCVSAGAGLLLGGCAFKYRGIHNLEPFGEAENGFLANLDWIRPNESTLIYTKEGEPVILLNHKGKIVAYKSICPHTSCELNDGERYQPLDVENNEIRCFLHDSYFDIESGKRLRGPAQKGSVLPQFKIEIRDGKIYRAS